MTAISIQSLNKHFASKQVLFDVDLDIPTGQMTALLGPSGSGKSTLLRHINALTVASSGTVTVQQNVIQDQGRMAKQARAHRAKIGFIFQQFNLVSRLSVLDNVLIGSLGRMSNLRSFLHWFTKEEKQKALSCLARVGLAELAHQRASTLSGGQQQRVAIAKVLMQEADIILADEPIASLDPEAAKTVMQALRDINRIDGKTVIVTLHQVDYARQYCDVTAALKKGRVKYYGDMASMQPAFLEALYGQDDMVMATPSAPAPTELNLQLN
ncbi:MAG: phosphonate ABC transporter ATP-binding protein [Neisseriaceae bacterium]|nr:phosphonate ABC transporter ATP-binding protein [Neisseriaceae bacterium]MBP6861934.1 phosphonate ABC transporter ATP-binding protein [Neisseriaceae bacterium]